MSTECLIMHLSRIIIYQEHIVNYLQRQNVHSTDYIFWDELFGLKVNSKKKKNFPRNFSLNNTEKSEQFFAGAGAYQSYCSQYPTFVVIIEQLLSENVQVSRLSLISLPLIYGDLYLICRKRLSLTSIHSSRTFFHAL